MDFRIASLEKGWQIRLNESDRPGEWSLPCFSSSRAIEASQSTSM